MLAITKSTPFAVSKDELNTKEDTSKNAFVHIEVCQMAPFRLKQCQIVKNLSL